VPGPYERRHGNPEIFIFRLETSESTARCVARRRALNNKSSAIDSDCQSTVFHEYKSPQERGSSRFRTPPEKLYAVQTFPDENLFFVLDSTRLNRPTYFPFRRNTPKRIHDKAKNRR